MTSIDPTLWSYEWWRDIGATAVTGGAAVVVSLAALVVALVGQRQAARADRQQHEAERRAARVEVESLIHDALVSDRIYRQPIVMRMVPDDPGRRAGREAYLASRDAERRVQAAIAVLKPSDAGGAEVLSEELHRFVSANVHSAPEVAHDRARIAAAITAAASDWVRQPREFLLSGADVLRETLRSVDASD